MPNETEIAVFGGGCFWCTEAIFSRVRGVTNVTSGYAGGEPVKPSYTKMILGKSQHAEVIRLEFDPKLISYSELLDIFWHVHDPTTLNQQGADIGPMYRSIILTTSPTQDVEARRAKQELEASHEFKNPILTEITTLGEFYTAESYHLKFYEKYPNNMYCQLVIEPKLEKFLSKYQAKLK